MMDAREEILSKLRRGNGARTPRPAYSHPVPGVNDIVSLFEIRAEAEGAQIAQIASRNSAPMAIASALAAADQNMRLHLPPDSPLRTLPWDDAHLLKLSPQSPGADDASLSEADYAIAETGTLVFFAGRGRPASWHFLPGREFVLLSRSVVLPTLEDVLAVAVAQGMPSTLNLVTGPSCTGDIEQTMEVGAHGPRQLRILMCD